MILILDQGNSLDQIAIDDLKAKVKMFNNVKYIFFYEFLHVCLYIFCSDFVVPIL